MKILHVWNTAGVASVIAKFVDRVYGTQSLVITRSEADSFGLTTYGRTYPEGPMVFFARSALMARKYDLVHVHSLDRLVPWVKRLYPSKPTLIHYHGTDILGRWAEKEGRWERADAVGYSTPNLSEGAPEAARYYPNPVDTDLFSPRNVSRVKKSALSIRYGLDNEAKRMAGEMSLDLTLIDRGSVRHTEMPDLLSRYEFYLDLRRPPGYSGPVHSLGKAALEALACGCRAMDWSGRIYEGLPVEHKPENVAREWYETYKRLLETRYSQE